MAHLSTPDLPLLAAIAEGEEVDDRDFRGRAEATLQLGSAEYAESVERLVDAGLLETDRSGAVIGLSSAGRARLRSSAP